MCNCIILKDVSQYEIYMQEKRKADEHLEELQPSQIARLSQGLSENL